MYGKKIWEFLNAIEVREYHDAKYGAPGQKRIKKRKPTPEEMAKVNQYNRERKARHKLREYFEVNDYFSCLTYRRDARPPDMATAKEHFKQALRFIRKEYKKRGATLFWMRNIEVGTKGGWHIHLIINRIPDTDLILKAAWQHGKVKNELLHEKGEFRQLAAYITKTPATDPRLKEADYSASRNMPLPEPDKRVYKRWKTWRDIKVKEGFYLDEESVREGINPVTGYPYREYTLLRIRRISRKERAG